MGQEISLKWLLNDEGGLELYAEECRLHQPFGCPNFHFIYITSNSCRLRAVNHKPPLMIFSYCKINEPI